MIKIENIETFAWESAVRGARNPMNSWEKSDSYWITSAKGSSPEYCLGENDYKLLCRLANSGPDHGKFMRQIIVTMDITAPLYWWKEFDTYKVGTVANSCSTMHKIQANQFTLDDFSHEHLTSNFGETYEAMDALCDVIGVLNRNRDLYNQTKDKKYWWNMIQILPSSYNQKRTVTLNYQVLRNIYHARLYHKLDEWRTLCAEIKKLPYSELITGENV